MLPWCLISGKLVHGGSITCLKIVLMSPKCYICPWVMHREVTKGATVVARMVLLFKIDVQNRSVLREATWMGVLRKCIGKLSLSCCKLSHLFVFTFHLI